MVMLKIVGDEYISTQKNSLKIKFGICAYLEPSLAETFEVSFGAK